MDLTRILRRHQFSRGEAAALLASQPKVFEVTDLVIPAGTNWAGYTHQIGSLELPLDSAFLYGLYLEVTAAPGADHLDLQVSTPGGFTDNIVVTADAVQASTGNTDFALYVPDGSLADPQPLSVFLSTQAVTTTADIRIVRARAAFLVI